MSILILKILLSLEELKSEHIKSYFQYLTKRGLKPIYINSILKNIRAFCAYCVDEEYLEKNPTEKVKWQRESKVIINTFTSEEIINMLNAYKFTTYLESKNKTIMSLLIDSGIRNSELCSIVNEDIKEKVILIHGKSNKQKEKLGIYI